MGHSSVKPGGYAMELRDAVCRCGLRRFWRVGRMLPLVLLCLLLVTSSSFAAVERARPAVRLPPERGSGPVDLVGQLTRAEVDQAAALDRAVLAIGEAKPIDGSFLGVNNQDLIDLVCGIEVELVPRLVFRRDNLDHDCRGVLPLRLGILGSLPASGRGCGCFL